MCSLFRIINVKTFFEITQMDWIVLEIYWTISPFIYLFSERVDKCHLNLLTWLRVLLINEQLSRKAHREEEKI